MVPVKNHWCSPSISLSISLSITLSIYHSIYRSVNLSLCLSVSLSISLSILWWKTEYFVLKLQFFFQISVLSIRKKKTLEFYGVQYHVLTIELGGELFCLFVRFVLFSFVDDRYLNIQQFFDIYLTSKDNSKFYQIIGIAHFIANQYVMSFLLWCSLSLSLIRLNIFLLFLSIELLITAIITI